MINITDTAEVPVGNDGKTWPETFDASVWATEFCNRFPESDWGTMLAWFANAIMRGYDCDKGDN